MTFQEFVKNNISIFCQLKTETSNKTDWNCRMNLMKLSHLCEDLTTALYCICSDKLNIFYETKTIALNIIFRWSILAQLLEYK